MSLYVRCDNKSCTKELPEGVGPHISCPMDRSPETDFCSWQCVIEHAQFRIGGKPVVV